MISRFPRAHSFLLTRNNFNTDESLRFLMKKRMVYGGCPSVPGSGVYQQSSVCALCVAKSMFKAYITVNYWYTG